MATTFGLPDDDLAKMLADITRRFHQPLQEAGVRIAILLAANEDGDAVKHGGYPALATIKIIGLKDRLLKGYDAELVIDRTKFEELTKAQQRALIDHELSHIDLKRDKKTGSIQIDDLGRPKLRSVKGDWNTGDAFAHVIARHGQQAVEFLNIEQAHTRAMGVLATAGAA